MKPVWASKLAALALLTWLPVTHGAEPIASLTVREAWARATPPGAAVAAVYLTILGGPTADRLLDASTTRARVTQMHAVTRETGMARMRPTDGVDVPAHGKVVLAPEGLHLMLMELARPLAPGESFPMQLRFAHAGTVEVAVTVVAPDASAPAQR